MEIPMKYTRTIIPVVFLVVICSAAVFQDNEETSENLRGEIILGNTAKVRELIEAGADVNLKFDLGASRNITPFYLLCVGGWDNDAETGKMLIAAGANFREKFHGVSLLHVTATYAGSKAMTELLIEMGLDVNIKIDETAPPVLRGSTPLHIAAGNGRFEMSEVLIQNGADLKAKTSNQGYSALHLAALNDQKEIVELLIAKGAEVNAKSETGATPLDLAIEKRHEEMVALLRKHGGAPGEKY